ncbi:unnamed protein product [Brachionus calyciflorus]|uniref:Uncharacterized protein n=1 Tax=Brachionus calyciflorus TaxID=104777 RepID=A0A813W9X7_9BILA|nr:unnamed protein product [Brachionus calyciflorus]
MRIKTNYFNIRQHLEEAYQLYKSSRVETTLDMILSRFCISLDQYIYFLRWSISRATLFLKRSANMDIQYVIDPYGCAAYISLYMLKSNATMSRLLKNAVDEVVNDNQSTVRQRLVPVANKFNNCAEISAQELGVLEHYKNRPNTMNDVYLAEFAAYYDFLSKESARMSRNPNRLNKFVEDEDDIDDDRNDEHYEEET